MTDPNTPNLPVPTETPKLFPKRIAYALLAIGVMAFMTSLFQVGMVVGARRAQFACHWSDHFGPRPPDANGASGVVMHIGGNELILRGRDGVEKSILVPTSTLIRKQFEQIPFQAMQSDDQVVIFGSPNEQGQIQAKFIRVLPPKR